MTERPSSRLDDARVRIERAREHLVELAAAAAAFIQSKPYRFSRVHDEEKQQISIYFSVDRQPSARVSILAGDAIHSARVALDYAVWQLYAVRSGGRPTNKVKFPIHEKPADFLASDTVRKLRTVMPDVLAEIESAQPYQPEFANVLHALWLLHRLDIADKHHRLNIAMVACRLARVTGTGAHYSIPLEFIEPCVYFGDGGDPVEVLRLEDFKPVANSSVEVNAQIEGVLAFRDGPASGRGVAPTVERLIAEAAGCVDKLETFLHK